MIRDPADPYDDPNATCAPASIRREVEASLRRLGVERIDLYQFHWPDGPDTPIEDSWGEMARLVDEGKVRAAGVCELRRRAARARGARSATSIRCSRRSRWSTASPART